MDRAMALASQAFTALIPLLMLASALAPRSNEDFVADAIIRRFELTGSAADAVQQVFAHSGESSTGILSVVLLVFSGTSLARRMQRMYLQAWQLEPHPRVRASLNATLGLGALLIEIGLLYLARTLVRELPFDWVAGAPLSLLASLVLWTSVPWLLLDRRIAWRRLLPAGALAALGASLYGVASSIYMPHLMESYNQRYGLFGVTLSLIGWLLCISLIVVTATVVAAEFDRAQEPWARQVRLRLGLAHS
jgi:membrane protein